MASWLLKKTNVGKKCTHPTHWCKSDNIIHEFKTRFVITVLTHVIFRISLLFRNCNDWKLDSVSLFSLLISGNIRIIDLLLHDWLPDWKGSFRTCVSTTKFNIGASIIQHKVIDISLWSYTTFESLLLHIHFMPENSMVQPNSVWVY